MHPNMKFRYRIYGRETFVGFCSLFVRKKDFPHVQWNIDQNSSFPLPLSLSFFFKFFNFLADVVICICCSVCIMFVCFIIFGVCMSLFIGVCVSVCMWICERWFCIALLLPNDQILKGTKNHIAYTAVLLVAWNCAMNWTKSTCRFRPKGLQKLLDVSVFFFIVAVRQHVAVLQKWLKGNAC